MFILKFSYWYRNLKIESIFLRVFKTSYVWHSVNLITEVDVIKQVGKEISQKITFYYLLILEKQMKLCFNWTIII